MTAKPRVNAKIKGLDDTLRQLDRLGDAVSEPVLERSVMAGLLPIQNAAKENAPKLRGDLARSIHSEITMSTKERVEGATGTDKPYARIQEEGGIIRPKTAAALVFEVDGHLVVTQKVTIPAQPYMRPAFDEHKDEAVDEAAAVLRLQIERLTR